MSVPKNRTKQKRTKNRTWKVWALPALMLLSAMGLRSGQAEEREVWNLEARVPATTLGYVAINEVGTITEKLKNTAIMKMMEEPEMKEFLKPFTDMATKIMDDAATSGPSGRRGPIPPMVLEVIKQLKGLSGQVAIALTDMSAENGEPSVVASLDFGDNVADFITFINRMREEVDPKGEAFRSMERDGRTWWTIDGGPMPISATTFGSAFVIGTSPEIVQQTITGAVTDSLAKSESFTKTRGRMAGGDTSLLLYGNVESIMGRFGHRMDRGMVGIANTMGLDTVKAAGFGMSFVGDGFRDSFVVYAPNADHGLLSLVRTRPYSPDALRFVPSNAVYYQEAAINLESLLPNIGAMAAQIDASAEEELSQGLDHLRQAIGVDIEKELIAQMEGSMASYISMPSTGGLYPELVMMFKVKDPAEYEQTFQRFANGVAGMVNEEGHAICSVERRTYRDKPLYLFHLQKARGNDVMPFTPTWSFVGDWMMLTLVPHTMKEFIHRSSETGSSLASNEDFQRLQRMRPAETGAVTYYDTASIMNLLYDTAVPVLQTVVKPNMMPHDMPPLDWTKLPAARTMRPYMRSMAAFSTIDDQGLALSIQGPMPMIVAQTFLMAGMFVGMRQTSMMRARSARVTVEVPKRVDPRVRIGPSAASMERRRVLQLHGRTLGRAIDMFKLQHKRLPRTLVELTQSTEAGIDPLLSVVPKDPWGRSYVYRPEAMKYQVVSAGADGVAGTADDVRIAPAPKAKPGR